MTRSATEALAKALKGDEENLYRGFEEWADRILAKLTEEGWAVVPTEPIEALRIMRDCIIRADGDRDHMNSSDLRTEQTMVVADAIGAMLAAVNGEGA